MPGTFDVTVPGVRHVGKDGRPFPKYTVKVMFSASNAPVEVPDDGDKSIFA